MYKGERTRLFTLGWHSSGWVPSRGPVASCLNTGAQEMRTIDVIARAAPRWALTTGTLHYSLMMDVTKVQGSGLTDAAKDAPPASQVSTT